MNRLCLLLLILWTFSSNSAEGTCRWVVHGQLQSSMQSDRINTENQLQPISGVDVRVQARWSTGGWWNSVNWPQATSSSTGAFTIQSSVFDPLNCKKARDIRLQLRTGPWGEWETHVVRSFSGPANAQGEHHVYLHNSSCTGICSGQVIKLDGDISVTSISSDQNRPDEITDSTMVAVQDECLARRSSDMLQPVDLTFALLPESNSLTTDDGLFRVERRSNAHGVTHNRLTLVVNIRNNSENDYKDSSKCQAELAFAHNEGPNRRSTASDSYPWFNWFRKLDDINANGQLMVSKDTNLLGSGDVQLGEWSNKQAPEYTFVLLRASLDYQNRVREIDEDNNQIEYCYNVPEHRFVAMSNCIND